MAHLRGLVVLLSVASMFAAGSSPAGAQGKDPLAPMKFEEVREVAPGVFFRFASISAADKSIPFGGCNNIWIVFDEFVVLFDANFPKEAGDVLAAIKKTTDKPVRYVLDSHHHGDHAYGNAVHSKAGASIVAQANCARILRVDGPKQFAEAGRGPMGRKDIANSKLKVPDLIFDDKLVLDDGKQRVEFLFLGHAHTAGDAVAWLPKHGLLCTGDACVNGAYNFMGHSDSASWIRVLDRMRALKPKLVLPGHGPIAGPDVIDKQQRYFVELREQVRKGIDAGKDVDDIIPTIDMPWHKPWTGIEARERVDNIRHVYDELTGRTMPWELVEDFGVYEGPSPTKKSRGWKEPKKIVVPMLMPSQMFALKKIAPEVAFVPVRTAAEAAQVCKDADAVLGFCTEDIVRTGSKLRWIQVNSAGVENYLFPALKKSGTTLTNTARIYGPNVADQAFALLLALTRGLQTEPGSNDQRWKNLKGNLKPQELHGKTMLVVGLGGIGTQIARRAHAFGMKVQALDPNEKIERPPFVFSLEKPGKLMDRLPQADVVVLACPLTEKTKGLFGGDQFRAMKKSAFLINIARGGIVRTEALAAALNEEAIAGAGLDVTDPEPLPDDHPLWKVKNLVVSPHQGGQSAGARERQWLLFRENVRRFVAGEPLLCVVDKTKGY